MDKDALQLLLARGQRRTDRPAVRPTPVDRLVLDAQARARGAESRQAHGQGRDRPRRARGRDPGGPEHRGDRGAVRPQQGHGAPLARTLRTEDDAPVQRASMPAAIAAREAGLESCVLPCPRHGDTKFVREGRGYYRCVRCRVESVAEHRRGLKDLLVQEAGGRCALCGYDRHPRALEFHHTDPGAKTFALSQRGVTLSLDVDARRGAQVRAAVLQLPRRGRSRRGRRCRYI